MITIIVGTIFMISGISMIIYGAYLTVMISKEQETERTRNQRR